MNLLERIPWFERWCNPNKTQKSALSAQIKAAHSYQEYDRLTKELDVLLNAKEWQEKSASNFYDYTLLDKSYNRLLELGASKDLYLIKNAIRSRLLRNFAGIHNSNLYHTGSSTGTKVLITNYLKELVSIMKYLEESEFNSFDTSAKIDFFNECKINFGTTALMFEGGASFGLMHLGVAKALYEHKILPNIICGSSVGALIAALVCCRPEADLEDVVFKLGGINLLAFAQKNKKDGNALIRRLHRLLTLGYLLDVKVIENVIRDNVGELTFEEAHFLTGRVLNITVSSSRKNEIPKVLNYLTAPRVLIWSACCASIATFGLYNSVDLLAKDKDNIIVPWSSSKIIWNDTYYEEESRISETRLGELFGVNHFIYSQATQVITPFVNLISDAIIGDTLKGRITNVIGNEIRHRVGQLTYLGVIPKRISMLFDASFGSSSSSGNSAGSVKIIPKVKVSDLKTVFSNPTYTSISFWTEKGEQSTWPLLPQIEGRTMVEREIDCIINRLTVKRTEERRIDDVERSNVSQASALKRTKSVI